jgi:hypothetical protein
LKKNGGELFATDDSVVESLAKVRRELTHD